MATKKRSEMRRKFKIASLAGRPTAKTTKQRRTEEETVGGTRRYESVRQSETDTVNRSTSGGFHLYTSNSRYIRRWTVEKRARRSASNTTWDGVVTHASEQVATNSAGDVFTDAVLDPAPKKRQATPRESDDPTIPFIIVSPPSTTEAAPAIDTEPVKVAATTPLAGKTYLKPNVLYPPTASIERADVCLGYPKRVASREQTDSSESPGAVGVTTSWESPLKTHDLVRQNAKTQLVDDSAPGESQNYHMSTGRAETDNRSRLLETLCLDDTLDLSGDAYSEPRWASATGIGGGQAVATRGVGTNTSDALELNSNANIRAPSDGGSSVDDDDEFSVMETTAIILATSDDDDDDEDGGRKVHFQRLESSRSESFALNPRTPVAQVEPSMRSVGVGSGGLRMSTSLVDATSPESGGDVYVTRGTCRDPSSLDRIGKTAIDNNSGLEDVYKWRESDTAMLLTSSGSEEDTDMGSPIDQHQQLHRKQQAAPGGDVCAILRSPLMTDRYDSGAASANCPPWLNRGLYRPSDEYRPNVLLGTSGAAETQSQGVLAEPPDAAATTDGLDEWQFETTTPGGEKAALIERLNALMTKVKRLQAERDGKIETAYRRGLHEMSESMYRAERLIENRAARINCLQQQHEEILEYMRAKEEEWELVRERMHREIKILRRQNTESLSLKIDAGEGPGYPLNGYNMRTLLRAKRNLDQALIAVIERQNKVNELRLSVVQQQRYVVKLEDSIRQLQERNLLLLNGGARRANETDNTQDYCLNVMPQRTKADAGSYSNMLEVLTCDRSNYTPGVSTSPDVTTANIFSFAGKSNTQEEITDKVADMFTPLKLAYVRGAVEPEETIDEIAQLIRLVEQTADDAPLPADS
ncbi:hypothetical protein LSAT2_001937 [Lamellibrachia satsuma]|nr:hypothetical protein LSAT2_001937 [Lamellibrachia satsuma]